MRELLCCVLDCLIETTHQLKIFWKAIAASYDVFNPVSSGFRGYLYPASFQKKRKAFGSASYLTLLHVLSAPPCFPPAPLTTCPLFSDFTR